MGEFWKLITTGICFWSILSRAVSVISENLRAHLLAHFWSLFWTEITITLWSLTRPKKGTEKCSKNVPFFGAFWWHLRGGTSISVSNFCCWVICFVVGLLFLLRQIFVNGQIVTTTMYWVNYNSWTLFN